MKHPNFTCHVYIFLFLIEDFMKRLILRFIYQFQQVEKQRAELNRELEDLSERLDEAGGATSAQVHFFVLKYR